MFININNLEITVDVRHERPGPQVKFQLNTSIAHACAQEYS